MELYNYILILGFLLTGFVSFWLTNVIRLYALKKSLLDIPNTRSSHTEPVPRGGGLAFVITFLVGLTLILLLKKIELEQYISILGASGLIAAIGLLDDRHHIPAKWRLLVHFISAAWALSWLGGLPTLSYADIGWYGYIFGCIYIVWLLNLYNFMDGINGIASIEAITTLLGGIVLYLLIEVEIQSIIHLFLLCATVIGFLVWNFPHAKIFMGDVGSGFLGITIAVLSIQAAWVEPKLFWGWVILLGVFIVDSTITLLRRTLRGDRFYQAHCSHAYQWAARRWGHTRVTISVLIINVFWLYPLAYLTTEKPEWDIWILIVAFVPLIILALYLGAGRPEEKVV